MALANRDPASAHPRTRTATSRPQPERRPWGAWSLALIPLLILGLFVWQLVSPLVHSDVADRAPASIGRITLEAEPAGTRLSLVLLDKAGQDTTADGTLDLRLREPDGRLWQTTRTVSASDFGVLPGGGLLGGRLGYSVVVPSSVWTRPPRDGGLANLAATLTPADGSSPISGADTAVFP